jgi:hypothetical protein
MHFDPNLSRAANNLIASHGQAAAAVARHRSVAMDEMGLKEVALHWRRVAERLELQPEGRS